MASVISEPEVTTEEIHDAPVEIKLIAEADGGYAVICNGETVGSGLTFAEAIGVGTEKSPLAPFLIRRLPAS